MLRHYINIVQSGPDREYELKPLSFNLAEPEDDASLEIDNLAFSRNNRIYFSPEFNNGPGSPKDFTACSLEDYGYYGYYDY
jgi:hypothetical protein